MPDSLLILRDREERWESFSPQELQGVIDNFMTWNRSLEADDRFVAAGKLTADRGVTVRARAGEVVIDGPYAEAKEAIAGNYQIRADTIDDATPWRWRRVGRRSNFCVVVSPNVRMTRPAAEPAHETDF